MSEKAMWPLAFILATLVACITLLLALRIDVIAIVLAFTLIGTLASTVGSIFIYNKVSKVEANTNGKTEAQDALLKDLVEYVKTSTPNKES